MDFWNTFRPSDVAETLAEGLAFRIEGPIVVSSGGPLATSRVSWESEPVSQTADEAMQAESRSSKTSASDEAIDGLREILATGPVAAAEDSVRRRRMGSQRKPSGGRQRSGGYERRKPPAIQS
jgi:hypothetical protein